MFFHFLGDRQGQAGGCMLVFHFVGDDALGHLFQDDGGGGQTW